MHNDGSATGESSPSLSNVSFFGNWADDGGAMFNLGPGGICRPSLSNVILWGNTASSGCQIYNDEATPVISYTLI